MPLKFTSNVLFYATTATKGVAVVPQSWEKEQQMQKKCPTTLVKDQQQSSIQNFLTFYCTMHNSNEPFARKPQELSTNIKIQLSVEVPQGIIKAVRADIGTTAKAVLGVLLSTFLTSVHTPDIRRSSRPSDVCVQHPAEELQIYQELPK